MIYKLKNGQEVDCTISRIADAYYLLGADNIVKIPLDFKDNSFTIQGTCTDLLDDKEDIQNKLVIDGREFLNDEYNGIEEDAENEIIQDEDPFDPKLISIDRKVVAMDTILRRLEQGSFYLSPSFQRKEVWSDDRKSRLIESLLLKIPIPMFYVSSNEKGVWTVVDGLQRLSTIRDFVLGTEYLRDPQKHGSLKGHGMRLSGLEFWTDLDNCNMNDLPIELSNRLLETEFTFTIINPGTPEEVKRNIFKRINTGGMPLSSQEIRNALYGGEAADLLNDLANLKEFKEATDNSIKTHRMEDKELILRFVAFLLRSPILYDKTYSSDEWLSDTMIIYNAMPSFTNHDFKKLKEKGITQRVISSISKEEIKGLFSQAMKRAYHLFGNSAFRKNLPGQRRAPINKSLFETWGVLLARMPQVQYEKILNSKQDMYVDYEMLLSDDQFVIAISRDSMKHASVKYRYLKISELIKKFSI